MFCQGKAQPTDSSPGSSVVCHRALRAPQQLHVLCPWLEESEGCGGPSGIGPGLSVPQMAVPHPPPSLA